MQASRPASAALLLVLAGSFVVPAASAKAAEPSGDTPAARRTTDALNVLEARGFCADLQDKGASAFVDFRPQGDDFAATVEQKGRQFTVLVNPETGAVTRQN